MSNFTRQNEIKMAIEPFKVQQPSEMDKSRCITNTAHSPITKYTAMGTIVFSKIRSD